VRSCACGNVTNVANTASRNSRVAFILIFLTVLLDMLTLGVIVPALPALVVAFRGGDTVVLLGGLVVGGRATVLKSSQAVEAAVV
jgi:thiamine transporter ThiT